MPRNPNIRSRRRAVVFAMLLMGGVIAVPSLFAVVPDRPRFNRDIRPILSDNCFYCHGPDEKKREADRRLDTRDGALREHDGLRAIVPGQPDASELLVRVLTHDRDELMPPPKSKKPRLTGEQVATLQRWIEQGAEYEGHWAFLPVAKATPPAVQNLGWCRNPIDRFVLARLDSEKLAPSPEADRATLIRRVSLDLTGLLPSPKETAAFLADEAPDAYERLVDRLLASPHYGERWGRHWLDQARYADSNGYTIDGARAIWPFRDWVIKALNDDLPFDEFTIDQLAGDLLPNPKKSQIVATAFHRNTLINEEGGVDKEQFRNEAVVDRVNTTGAVWLGLTVGCAQCHTHKFDPISHREYYQMFAFFNQGSDVNNKGETIPVARGEIFGQPVVSPSPASETDVADLARQQADWEKQQLARLQKTTPATGKASWVPAKYLEYDTAAGAGFRLLPDQSLLADGRGAFNDTYRIVVQTPLKKIAAVRLRVLSHESLPRQGPGLAKNGNFVLTDFEVTADGREQEFARASADHEQPGYAAVWAIDNDPKSGWAINVSKESTARMNTDHEAVFVFAKEVEIDGRSLEIKLHHDLNQNYLIGRFAIDFAETAPADGAPADAELAAALQAPPNSRTDEQRRLLRKAFEQVQVKASARRKADPNPNVAELMVMKETETPRPTFIHLRGDFLRHDAKTGPLTPGVIAAVNAAYRQPIGKFRHRLDLAHWLVDADNPLTSRVTVNRMWMHYFGRGLVETEEDFGTQGTPPTHPELLDWLARTFVERGWSMKAMHRLIVTSASYRQSSKARPELAKRDPRNLLLARQERLRLDAEIVRDAALSASGLLDHTLGGPSVHPPQAEGVYAFTQNTKKWVADTGANRFRRAMYTTFYRAAPYPLFGTFDAPDFQTVCTRRARSNTPLQALTVANDPAFLEMAQGLAARILREAPNGTVDEWIQRAFLLGLCRKPRPVEVEILRVYFEEQRTGYDAASAEPLLTVDLKNFAVSPATAAATVCLARTVLNTDNFITRE